MVKQFEAIDLPGQMLYDKQFCVKIRKITPIEQRYILSLSQKQQRSEHDYIEFIKSLIEFDNPEMTFEELFTADIQYILYRIRFTTYAKYPIKLKFTCDNIIDKKKNEVCKTESSYNLDMGNLQIITPDDIQGFSNEITLENFGKIKIRNKKQKDEELISAFSKQHDIPEDDPIMQLLLIDLCAISDNGKSLEELFELANDGTITAEDIVDIEHWLINNVWGVKEEVLVKCPKCGKEVSKAYSLALEDFFSAF